jgi:ABC-type phosphate/phosphonate transport system substrate-binding protein
MIRSLIGVLVAVCCCFPVWAEGAEDSGVESALLRPETTAEAGDSVPLVLKIAVNDIYCTKTACECISEIATRDYAGLVMALKEKHNITLEMSYFMEVYDLEKAIVAKTHDGVICKPWTALRLAKQARADFKRVADLRDIDDLTTMTGVFVTLKSSPVNSLEDLKGRRVVFGEEDSYEKNQSPLALLAAKKIQPAQSLNRSSCSENIDALLNGDVDVAVISDYALTASCAVDFAEPEDFKTIAKTPEIPLTSLLLDMKKTSPDKALRLQKALLSLTGDQVPEDLGGSGFVMPASWKPRVSEKTTEP